MSAESLRLQVVAAAEMTPLQTADVVDLCGGVFQLDYAYLLGLVQERTHVLGYVGDRLVCHALWLRRRLQTGGVWYEVPYVEGVATAPDWRRRGCGSEVLLRVVQAVQDWPFAALSPARPEWYLAQGWERWRGALSIHQDGALRPTPGEILLVHRTPRTPSLDLDAPLAGEWRSFGDW